MADQIPVPAAADLVRRSGYRPDIASVLAMAVNGAAAGLVIDTNGDHRWLVVDTYQFVGGQWTVAGSGGAGLWGESHDVVSYVYGCGRVPGAVTVGALTPPIAVGSEGWWIAVWLDLDWRTSPPVTLS